MIDVKKLNMILNQHATAINEQNQESRDQEKRIKRLERNRDDLYELITNLEARTKHCEAYTQAVDYLMHAKDEYKAPQGANRRRRVVVKSGGQTVEITRV